MNSNITNINSLKYNYQNSHNKNNIQLINKFHVKNKFNLNDHYKSQNKKIKISLTSQKFKIADDFNGKNSQKFLIEKDECLRDVILSNKIEEEESIHFYAENKNEIIYELSPIKLIKYNNNLNRKQVKRKKVEIKLIEDQK